MASLAALLLRTGFTMVNTSAFDSIWQMLPAQPSREDCLRAMLATMDACADVAHQHANELSQRLAKPYLDTFTAHRLQSQLNGSMQAMEKIQLHKKTFQAQMQNKESA